jgi:hypothetical protein
MIDINNPPKRLCGKQAAEYLARKHGIVRTPGTLAKLRCVGGGPTFQVAGRAPLYLPSALDDWAEHILSRPMRSTSDTTTLSTRGIPPAIACKPRAQSQHDQTKPDQDRAPPAGDDQ